MVLSGEKLNDNKRFILLGVSNAGRRGYPGCLLEQSLQRNIARKTSQKTLNKNDLEKKKKKNENLQTNRS
jgi:hypothetical protein